MTPRCSSVTSAPAATSGAQRGFPRSACHPGSAPSRHRLSDRGASTVMSVLRPAALNARLPPSTGSNTPVTIAAASDTRKSTGPTISCGSPSRLAGIPERNLSIRPSPRATIASLRPGVRNWHGWMAFTRMPWVGPLDRHLFRRHGDGALAHAIGERPTPERGGARDRAHVHDRSAVAAVDHAPRRLAATQEVGRDVAPEGRVPVVERDILWCPEDRREGQVDEDVDLAERSSICANAASTPASSAASTSIGERLPALRFDGCCSGCERVCIQGRGARCRLQLRQDLADRRAEATGCPRPRRPWT